MTGKSLGPYRIVEQLGKGGMGEVWLAEDTRLDRKVAVKVLPAALAGDADRRQRFEQEAKAAAALNHPNIAAIHDVGVATGEDGSAIHYMVQEYLRGETLREAISRGPLPFDKAVSFAVEVAEALKTAHRAGIVHRDLKPENLFITQDGHAKVLDFGLAKLTEFALASGGSPSMSPTMTMAGQILGTAGYMSPEQVRGEEVDERADLFALGCVLYEMITGKQAFGGGNVHESLSRILGGEPDPIAPASPQFGWILEKLLAKDREQRYQSAGDVIVDLRRLAPSGDTSTQPAVATPPPASAAPTRRSPGAFAVVATAALLVGAAGAWLLKPPAGPSNSRSVRFDVMLAAGSGFSSNYNRVATISPDSRVVAYTALSLWLRPLDRSEARAIPNTVNARAPAFSPDSRQIAFWESGHIKRAALEGGVPIIVGPLHERPMGMNWAADDFIYIGRADRGIWRVPAAGGELEQVLALGENEYAHGPELLPGGEWIVFSLSRSVRAWVDGSIVAQSVKTNERRLLVKRGREARYASSGHLTYVQDSSLFAAPFDADRVEVTGGAVAMETGVHTSGEDETGAAGYDLSDDGVLVFAPPAGMGVRDMRLAFLDRDGNEEMLPMGVRRFRVTRLSPDGARIATQVNDIEGTHIWILAVDRDGAQRLTTSGRNTSPVWSHDGRYVYFASDREGDTDIWRRRADLSLPAEHVLEIAGAELPTSISQDGKWLYYSSMAPGNSDIGRLSLVGDPVTEMLVESPADELYARVSGDGRFFCFQSDETGRWDIHVMEIDSRRRWIVSPNEGYSPLWTADGKRIVFMGSAAAGFSVDVETEPDFSAADPVPAFDVGAGRQGQTMDVDRTGERVLIGFNDAGAGDVETRPRVTVVLNWFDRLEERFRDG